MTKKPADFKITGDKGINIIVEDFFGPETPIPAEARLTHTLLEDHDYGNEKRLSLTFQRHNNEGILPLYRDVVSFYRSMEAKDVIKELEKLTARLQQYCVEYLDPKKRKRYREQIDALEKKVDPENRLAKED